MNDLFSSRQTSPRTAWLASLAALMWVATSFSTVSAQMGGMGGMGGGGGQPPPAEEKARFRDHIHTFDDLGLHREKGDVLVGEVSVIGNKRIASNTIFQKIRTRQGRYYDYQTVLADVRRILDMQSFENVTFETADQIADDGTPVMNVRFKVRERSIVTRVVMHGNRRINDRELINRGHVRKGDPLSEFSIEAGKRRLVDYYHEKGFNQAAIESSIGLDNDPTVVIYRINEGHKERIQEIRIFGSTIVTEARLKKVISSRDSFAKVIAYLNNTADMEKIEADLRTLQTYYQDLGFLTATVGRVIQYDETGKWLTVHFTIDEGPRFSVNEIQIIGSEFITEQSVRERLKLNPGDVYSGVLHRTDIAEMTYGYGEQGFIYAEIEPQTVMREEDDKVDLVYEIAEGDRWRVGNILVNIEGDPYLMKERTMLNMVDLREGAWIDLRSVEMNRSRLIRSTLFETNPQVADAPDIKIVPRGEKGKLR